MSALESIDIIAAIDPEIFPIIESFREYHEGVTITDKIGTVLFMNKVQLKMDDFIKKETIGRIVTDLYRVDEGHSPTMACLKTGKIIKNLAVYYRTHLGRIVNSIHNVYPILVSEKVIGCIVYITDFKNIEHSFDAVTDLKGNLSHPFNEEEQMSNGTRYKFKNIIGGCRSIINAKKIANLASESASPVLIYGETGTGKELFAQSIHNKSSRKHSPFLAINCASIPENLLEGLLFGTSKGAFTGAAEKAGLFEMANGGTVLLDELNSMPLTLQAKILRFLQERKIRRIGSMKEVNLDLKILSTINIPPEDAIETRSIRPDLYYRLAVVVISIPSLVNRGDDIELLTNHFLLKKNQLLDKQVVGLSMEVQELFRNYDWPGNVRELEHLIEGAMNLVGSERVIDKHHLPETIAVTPRKDQVSSQPLNSASTVVHPTISVIPTQGKTLAELKSQYEFSILSSELLATHGNAAKAAKNLGMSPQMMNYKLKRFQIDRKDFL